MHVDVLYCDVPIKEILFIHNPAMKWDEVFNPGNHCLIESGAHSTDGVVSVTPPDQQFGKQ
jgi:hypothetical protein